MSLSSYGSIPISVLRPTESTLLAFQSVANPFPLEKIPWLYFQRQSAI